MALPLFVSLDKTCNNADEIPILRVDTQGNGFHSANLHSADDSIVLSHDEASRVRQGRLRFRDTSRSPSSSFHCSITLQPL